MADAYCWLCGAETKKLNGYTFDSSTGKRATYLGCVNTSCVKGCENMGGHKMKGWFWRSKCSRCGRGG